MYGISGHIDLGKMTGTFPEKFSAAPDTCPEISKRTFPHRTQIVHNSRHRR